MATKTTTLQAKANPDSKNEPKKTAISFSSYQEDYVSPRNWEIPWLAGEGGFISWAEDNLFAQFLVTLYDNSPTHGSIINGKATHITGQGLYSESSNKKLTDFIDCCNSKGDSLLDIWRKVVLDEQIFGGFALKIIWNRGRNKIAEIYYVDIQKYRFNIEGDRIKYSKNWDQWQVYNQQTLAANKSNFNINAIEEYLYSADPNDIKESGGQQIFYYSGIASRSLYPRPSYMQGINPIITDIEASNYHRSNIQSGMFPNMTVQTFVGLPNEDERKVSEKAFLEKFGKTDKAGGVVFIYNEPGAEAAKVEPIQDNQSDQKFITQSKETRESIYGIHMCSPAVFGIAQEGKLGDNQQLKAVYDNFRKLVVQPKQSELVSIFNKLLSNTFKKCDLKVKPIPQLGNFFTTERIISANMTNQEIRTSLKEDGGWIEDVELDGEVIGDKNIPNLNFSDKALAEKNLATAVSLTPGKPLPTLEDDETIDTTTQTPEPEPEPEN